VRAHAPSRFAHDFTRVSPYAQAEREADRAAEEIARGEAATPAAQRTLAPDPPQAPNVVAAALAAPAKPLYGRARNLVARHLGDAAAAQIRVHDHPSAHRAARALGASAFAAGRHIVFGDGKYRDGTIAGDALLAHEAAHLGQQAARGASRIDCSPDAPLPKRYQRLLDRIRSEENDNSIIGAWHLRVLYAMEELALAAESGDIERTKKATVAFFAASEKFSIDPATAALLEDVPMTLVTRVYLLGLVAESKQLETYFFTSGKSTYEQPTRERGYATRWHVVASIAEDAAARGSTLDARLAEAGIDLILRAFRGVLDAAAALDPATIRKEEEEARREVYIDSGFGGGLGMMNINPDRNAAGHYSHLLGLLPALVTALMRSYQALLDDAVADLEAGKGNAKLNAVRAVLDQKMKPVFNAYPHVPLAGLAIDATKSDFGGKKKRHLDIFDPKNKAAQLEIEPYQHDSTNESEKQITLTRLYDVRAKQLAALEHLYGFAMDKGKVAQASAENAAAIKTAGGLKLHDNDSWRAFLLAKFEANKAATKDDWKALLATIDVLRVYLDAFTVHTPYNIAEFGDPYLTRTFPRALTGQLIHDCGVYALRVAYVLSLVRTKLNLTFRAIVLPVHVGLIISYGDDVSRGAIFVHNNELTPVDGQTLLSEQADWEANVAKEEKTTKPAKKDEAKTFLADEAASYFVERVNLPYHLVDVPQVPGAKATPKERHAKLWDFYHSEVITKQTTAPVKDVPQPELLFLDLLEADKDLHNRLRVPAYRAAFELREKNRKELDAAAMTFLQSNDPAKVTAAKKVLDEHRDLLIEVMKPLRARMTELKARRDEVDAFLEKNPKAIGKGATLARWKRLDWSDAADAYLGDATTAGELAAGLVHMSPWEHAKNLPPPID
jgi:hypothetical protein